MAVQQTRKALSPNREPEVEARRDEPRRALQYGSWSNQLKPRHTSKKGLATALGWFSIGLGLAEIVAPRSLAKLIGVRDDYTLLFRLLGLREITSGIGILTQSQPTGWLWSRVAGDCVDLSLLGASLVSDDSDQTRVAVAAAAVAGVTALDIFSARQSNDNHSLFGGIARVKSITVNRPPEEVYHFWRNFENLPRFMSHLESVQVIDERRSHWAAKAPAGMKIEWDAEITEDRPNELIAWCSLEGASVKNLGSVRFVPAPRGRGTEIKVSVLYDPPGGAIGAAIAKLFGEEPEQQIKGDLYRLKQVLETGEVVRSDASIHSGMYPAQPAAD